MHIGCCENCRYIDLVENVTGVCPRCGNMMTSLGIESSAWNAMGDDERSAMIAGLFPEDDTVTDVIDREEAAEADGDTEITHGISEEVPEDTEAEPADSETVHEGDEAEPEDPETVSEDNETLPKDAGTESEDAAEEYDDTENVYVCYKCSSVAAYDGKQDGYYCRECGSQMINVGYTPEEWMQLTKEEKRRITEDAKIKHMVLNIKNTTYDDEENVTTDSIINVVR